METSEQKQETSCDNKELVSGQSKVEANDINDKSKNDLLIRFQKALEEAGTIYQNAKVEFKNINYKHLTLNQIWHHFRTHFANNKVYVKIFPKGNEIIKTNIEDDYGNIIWLFKVIVGAEIIDSENPNNRVVFSDSPYFHKFRPRKDDIIKENGSATTYGQKYVAMCVFQIGSGEDPDSNTEANEQKKLKEKAEFTKKQEAEKALRAKWLPMLKKLVAEEKLDTNIIDKELKNYGNLKEFYEYVKENLELFKKEEPKENTNEKK